MILVIDNYDSFVHNLARYIRLLGYATDVVRNDETDLLSIRKKNYEAIVLSPGPCTPNEAGVSLSVVNEFGPEKPILGICLGHQAIVQAYGGEIARAPHPMHGRATPIVHNGEGVFDSVPSPINVGRYHSLVGERESIPESLEVTATAEDGTIMAIRHKQHAVVGLQFHPESILTEHGSLMLKNFFDRVTP